MSVRKQVIDGYLRHGFTRTEAEAVFDAAAHYASQAATAATVTMDLNCNRRTERDVAIHLLAMQLTAALINNTADRMADDIKEDGGIVADFTRKEGVNDRT